jgi:cell division protein FtsL
MVISIDENILMGAAAVIFVPLFVFFIKLIIQMGTIQEKITTMNNTITEHKTAVINLNQVLYEMKIIKERLDRIEDRISNVHTGSPDLK